MLNSSLASVMWVTVVRVPTNKYSLIKYALFIEQRFMLASISDSKKISTIPINSKSVIEHSNVIQNSLKPFHFLSFL